MGGSGVVVEHWEPGANDPIRLTPVDPSLLDEIERFDEIEDARACARSRTVPQAIVLGDTPEYWVVEPAQAMQLGRVGYVIAEFV